MNLLLLVGSALLIFAVIPATLIVFEWRKVDWRSNTLGRVLHAKSMAIAVVLWLSTIASTLLLLGLGRPWWFELLRWFAFAYVGIVLWRQWRAYRSILTDATRHSIADDAAARRDSVTD